MSDRRIITRLAFAVAAVTAGIFIITGLARNHGHPAPAPDREAANEAADEAAEEQRRAEWEFLRQRDPATGRIPDGIKHSELAFAATLPGADAVAGGLAKSSSGSGIEWVGRGPYNVGGRTRALAVDVTDSMTILAGGVSGGMWRSTNGGASWARTTSPLQLPSVSCVVQDTRPGKTRIWYYGTGERYGNSAATYGDGVFKSTDGGASWQQLASTISGTPQTLDSAFDIVWRVVVDPSTTLNDVVYAATSGAVMRSIDGGRSWTRVLGGAAKTNQTSDVAVTSQGVVYAALGGDSATAPGLWRSADGINWTKISPAAWPATAQRIVIGTAPSNPATVYFLAETPGFGKLVPAGAFPNDEWHSLWRYSYVSGDGSGAGGVWDNRSRNLPAASGIVGGFRSQKGYDLTIAVEPHDENLVLIGGINLYVSTVGFATSGNTGWIGGYFDFGGNGFGFYPHQHPDQHAIAFSPSNPRVLYSANDGGIQRTDDMLAASVTWTRLNNGYVTGQFYSVAINEDLGGDSLVMGGMQDNGAWVTFQGSPTAPWLLALEADAGFCAVANRPGGRKVLYYSALNGEVLGLDLDPTNQAGNEKEVDPIGGTDYLFITPYLLDPNNNDVMYLAAGVSLWRNSALSGIPSTNTQPTSRNWSKIATSDTAITAIGVSRRNPSDRIYIGNAWGQIQRFDSAGHTHQPPVSPLAPLKAYVSCVAVDPDNGDRAIAVYSNYSVVSLFATTDGGVTWNAVSGNLEEHPDGSGSGPSCRWAKILHRPNGDIYFVGTSTGLYSTRALNGSETVWTQEGAGTIGNVVVNMIAARQSDGVVAIATHGNGAFSATVNELAGVGAAVTATAAGATLDEPYPNPVRERATMRYTLAGSGAAPVRLGVFDLAGHEVARLVDRVQPAGAHAAELVVEGSGSPPLPSGRYYCRLEAGGRVAAVRAVSIVR